MNKPQTTAQPSRWQPSWISLVISLCAFLFTLYQAYLQRQYLRLSVRPRMTISFFYNNEGAGYMFGGTGIGYATLKSFEVLVDGKPQPDWAEMAHALGFATRPTMEFTVPRREVVFKPDSYNKVFWIPSGPQSDELITKAEAGRIFIKACYCSVFEDECWKVDTRNTVPESVDSCPKPEIIFTAPQR